MTVRSDVARLALLTDEELEREYAAELVALGIDESEAEEELVTRPAEDLEWLSRVEVEHPLAAAVLWQAPDEPWDQRRMVASLVHPLTLVLGGNRGGKAQPLDALILTPTGWRRLGELLVGDRVIAGDGSVTQVTGVFPQGRKPVVRMTFDDGATTQCCDDHLWVVRDGEQRFRKSTATKAASSRLGTWGVLSAGEIRRRWGERPTARRAVAIPVVGREDRSHRSLPLDPYLLGVILGDGGLTGRGSVIISSADADVLDEVRASLPIGCRLVHRSAYDWAIVGNGKRGGNAVLTALCDLALTGVGSAAKRVPEAFLFASADQRMALLQGLMDTDGTADHRGHTTFDSTSRGLALDVQSLVRSLGGKATLTGPKRNASIMPDGSRVPGADSWRVFLRLDAEVFRLPRKRARLRHRATVNDRILRSIVPDGSAECQCIAVAHPSRTYVTDDYIVTHNTYAILEALVAFALGGDHPAVQIWLEDNDLPRDLIPDGPGECYAVAPSAASSLKIHRLDLHDLLPAGAHWRGMHAAAEAEVEIPVPGYDQVARIWFKSVDQGHRGYKGDQVRFVAISEEPEGDEGKLVLAECMRACAATGGRVVLEMTPQNGITWVHDDLVQDRQYGCELVVLDSMNNRMVQDYASLQRWLGSLSEDERRMRQKGEFVDRRGLIYGGWSRGDGDRWGLGCLCDDFDIPKEWPRFRVCDWGQTSKNGTGCLWGALGDDALYLYREYYVANEPSFKVHARDVCLREPQGETFVASWADHEPEAIAAFAEIGIRLELADKDVASGISRCADRLRIVGTRPRLKVFRSLKRFIWEIENYRRDSNKRDGAPIKKDDHLVDCWRYMENGIDGWYTGRQKHKAITGRLAGLVRKVGG